MFYINEWMIWFSISTIFFMCPFNLDLIFLVMHVWINPWREVLPFLSHYSFQLHFAALLLVLLFLFSKNSFVVYKVPHLPCFDFCLTTCIRQTQASSEKTVIFTDYFITLFMQHLNYPVPTCSFTEVVLWNPYFICAVPSKSIVTAWSGRLLYV